MPRIYRYKLTINEDYWSDQLETIGKKLTKKDCKLIKKVRREKENNEALDNIHERALTDGLCIKDLTDLDGNCLFESFKYVGLCDDAEIFRKSIALIFYLFGDLKVIPGYDETLKEIYNISNSNDIEYVLDEDTNILYKYSYYTMCVDMCAQGSWSRIPTNLILSVISVFYKVRFHIYKDDGNVNVICNEIMSKDIPLDDPESNIYLGLIGEYHYVPLSYLDTDLHPKCPHYIEKLKLFHKWARSKANLIGLYEDRDTDSDESAESDSS